MEIDRSPVSTTVIERKELEQRNIRQIDQALAQVEGVIAIRSKGPSDNDFGLGLRGFAGRGGQSRTLILVDGQPVNNSYIGNVNWSMFAVSEMERVEIARGPFSSLYGGNAMGGVVNLITRPVEKRQLEVFGQYGSRETTNYSLRAADRFFGKLGASIGYSRFQTGGYAPQEILRPAVSTTGGIPVTGVQPWMTATGGMTYQVGMRGRNWFNQEALRARGEYSLTPRMFLTMQYMRQSRLDGYDAYTTSLRDGAGQPVDSGTAVFLDGGITRRLTISPSQFLGTPTGGLLHIYQVQLLSTLTSQWNLRIAAGVNQSPSDWYVTPGASATLTGGPGNFVNQANRAIYGNAQLSGKSLLLGAETRQDRASITGQAVSNYALRSDPAAADSAARGQSLNQSGYVQYQRDLEKLHIVAGGRWDYWRTYDGGNLTGLHAPLNTYPDRTAQAFTGKVAAVYALPGSWIVRGSVGNAFRNPTVYDLYRDLTLSGILYLANPSVNPERLFAYEAGLQRSSTSGYGLEATYYVNRVSSLIYRTTDFEADPAGRIRRLTNAGLSRTRGVELATRQRVFSWLRLRQSYTFADAVITENPLLPATVGRRVPYVPRHTAAYVATAAKGRWSGVWAGRYVGSFYASDTNLDTTRGVPGSFNPFFEMDVTMAAQLTKSLSLQISADNLLDRRYYQSFLAQGRSVFAGFRWRM
ncbi:MAG TPA: TonB-dependent receptor [Bryobacteraceae bacterium]|nr:TonB-dependent receptor [Bryobacteraceae bacterium]